MRIIQPYDFKQITLQELIDSKKILPIDGNKVWMASIFPRSTVLNLLTTIDKDRIVTQLDDVLFNGFIVLNTPNQSVLVNNNTGRKYIKSIEIGDFNDSVKRYIQLDKPVDISTDARKFMNLPSIDNDFISHLDVSTDLIHKPGINLDDFLVKKRPNMFDTPVNHPHITVPTVKPTPFKNNNKAIIQQVFKWAAEKGIKYIYCINEYRPYIIDQTWATPYVYYTIKGSY